MMKQSRFLFFLFFILAAIACNRSDYIKTYQIKNEEWDMHEQFQFNLPVEDVTQRYNIYLNVRNTTDYSYSNIFFFVHVLYPDNKEYVDTVEGILSDTDGRWLGSGSGRYRNNKFLYKSNIQFPLKGTYVFTVEQAMRDTVLPGIASIGLEMSKIK